MAFVILRLVIEALVISVALAWWLRRQYEQEIHELQLGKLDLQRQLRQARDDVQLYSTELSETDARMRDLREELAAKSGPLRIFHPDRDS